MVLKGTKKIVKYQSKRVYKWTRELGIYIKSTSSKAKGHEWKANSCPLFIPLFIIFTERRARENDNFKLRFTAINLKNLSQHITCKLAFSLTRQLNSFFCLSVFLRKQIVNTSTKARPFVTQKNFVHLLPCLLSQATRLLVYLFTCLLAHSFTRLLPHLLTFNYHNLVVEILIVRNLYTRERIGLS